MEINQTIEFFFFILIRRVEEISGTTSTILTFCIIGAPVENERKGQRMYLK